MAGTTLTLTVDDAEVQAALDRAAAQAADLRPAMMNIGEALLRGTRERFAAQAGPDGVRWAPHAPATRRRRGAGAPILRERGNLFRSLVFQADGRSAEVGTNLTYAAIHQFGGSVDHAARSQDLYFHQDRHGDVGNLFVRRRRSNFARTVTIGAHQVTIPARPFLGIDAADRVRIIEILDDHLTPEGAHAA